MMKAIMHDVRVAPSRLVLKLSQESEPVSSESVSAPATPKAAAQRERQRAGDAEGGGLGRRRPAAIDRADDEGDEQHYRYQAPRRVDLLAEGKAGVGRWCLVTVEKRPNDHVAHEKDDQQQPRKYPGDEEAGDGDLGLDAVDDEDDRGRDQEPQRARPGKRPDRHALVIAAFGKLRQGHLADGHGGCRRRPRDGGEDAAADDVDVHEAPRDARHPRRKPSEHVLRQAGAKQDLAHPDEQRERGQGPGGAGAPDRGGHDQAGRRVGKEDDAEKSDGEQGQGHPKAAGQEEKQ
jgi:hypothetical protein